MEEKNLTTRCTILMGGEYKNLKFNKQNFSYCYGGEWKDYNSIIYKADAPYSSSNININKTTLRFVFNEVSIGGYASWSSNPYQHSPLFLDFLTDLNYLNDLQVFHFNKSGMFVISGLDCSPIPANMLLTSETFLQ